MRLRAALAVLLAVALFGGWLRPLARAALEPSASAWKPDDAAGGAVASTSRGRAAPGDLACSQPDPLRFAGEPPVCVPALPRREAQWRGAASVAPSERAFAHTAASPRAPPQA